MIPQHLFQNKFFGLYFVKNKNKVTTMHKATHQQGLTFPSRPRCLLLAIKGRQSALMLVSPRENDKIRAWEREGSLDQRFSQVS